jgi:hypothetical protein
MAILSLSFFAFCMIPPPSSGLLVVVIGIRWLSTTESTKMAHLHNLHHHYSGIWFAGGYVPSL